MPYRKQAAKNLGIAYISAFLIIALLATGAQVIIQLALHQEIIARETYVLLSGQAVASQQLQRNDVLLISQDPAVRRRALVDMQSNIDTMAANHVAYMTQYASSHPELKNIGNPPYNSYTLVTTYTKQLLKLENEQQPITQAVRIKQVYPLITKIFYASDTQLAHLVLALGIINHQTDSYIDAIQHIEIVLFALTMCVLLYELIFVIRPTLKRLNDSIGTTTTTSDTQRHTTIDITTNDTHTQETTPA